MDAVKIRQGRKVAKTIYIQLGEEPSDDDTLVGYIEDLALAALIVARFNAEPRRWQYPVG